MRVSKLRGLEDYIRNLYLSGFTCDEIKELLYKRFNINISSSGVYYFLVKLGVPMRRRGYRVFYPPHFGKITIPKSYIMGVLIGDGCIECREKGKSSTSYQIWLKCKDYWFAYAFKRMIEIQYNKKVRLVEKYFTSNLTPTPTKFYFIITYGKAIVYDLLSFVNYDRTKYVWWGWTVPDVIFDSDVNIKTTFLRGFADSDGSVRVSRNRKKKRISIFFYSKNKSGLKDIQKLLADLKIRSNIYKVNKDNVYGCLISRKKSVIRYAKLIGFYHSLRRYKLYSSIETFYNLKIVPPRYP